MNKERKANVIKALKSEINFYKKQLMPVNVVYKTELNHFCLSSEILPQETELIPEQTILDLLTHRISKAFVDNIELMPIEIKYDEDFGVYRARLDLWVKPKGF